MTTKGESTRVPALSWAVWLPAATREDSTWVLALSQAVWLPVAMKGTESGCWCQHGLSGRPQRRGRQYMGAGLVTGCLVARGYEGDRKWLPVSTRAVWSPAEMRETVGGFLALSRVVETPVAMQGTAYKSST
ncbi:hypothetical protein BDN71DRAFT_1431637 [Pleurotus eryngii]|uniref:Uncharacterized protein n=1 Tax=Pleurotus eryngii TaxID=5323 RepID=A0A9P6D7V2_PLEER|nr:hypothetical protein BDN71DRAFT_1431637 [Pleurotus eryngii]